jgi:hypothetical protein
MYPKVCISTCNRDTCTPTFILLLFTVANCPITGEWFNKMRYIYTMEYPFSHEEE